MRFLPAFSYPGWIPDREKMFQQPGAITLFSS